MTAPGSLQRLLRVLVLACALVVGARPAVAQWVLDPYAESHLEHDSNVYRLPNSQFAVENVGDPQLGDSDLEYLGGVDGSYLWGRDKLTVKLEGRHFDYEHYTDLNHNEYLGDVALDWKLASLLDGNFDIHQGAAMAPFMLGNSVGLTIDVSRIINSKVNFELSPDWRLETALNFSHLVSPLQDYPDFLQREFDTHVGLVYVGLSRFTYGVTFDHVDGRFDNAPDVGSYTQNGEALTGTYEVSALTSLRASIGYTRRSQAGIEGEVSGVTGALNFNRQLTGKTSLNVQVTRAINSYVAAGGSEIDTTGIVGLVWNATYLLTISANGGYTRSRFIGQVIVGAPGSQTNNRVDRSPYESLTIDYQLFRRLRLRAYAKAQSRTSDIELYNFSDTTMGVDVKVTWR